MPAKSDSFCVEGLESRRLLSAAVQVFPSVNITNEDPTPAVTFAGSMWFTAGRLDGHTLYRSDGTREGTVSTASTLPSLQTTDFHPYVGPVVAGAKMFLLTGRSGGYYNLNVTDGTSAGTRVINTSAKIQQTWRAWGTARGNKVYFSAGDTNGQWRLWESDGTDAGTKPISPVTAGIYDLVLAGFSGSDVYYYQSFTNGGTSLVRLSGTTATTLASTSASELQPLNATQNIFVGSSNNGQRLWVTDGTAGGTRPIDVAIKYVGGLSVLNNVAYFIGRQTNGTSGLYRTDGTRTGTYALATAVGMTEYPSAGVQTEFFAGRLYINGYSGSGYDGITVVNPDGSFQSLGTSGGSGDFYIESDRLYLNSLSRYVTADQPLLIRGTDNGGVPTASVNGKFLTIGTIPNNYKQIFAWDQSSPQIGSVSGYLTSDLNGNATLDANEPKLADTDVYIDLSANGVYDAGVDPKYKTASNGYFEFTNVPVGTWNVAPVAVPGVVAPSGTQSVLVSPGFSIYGLNVLASSHARLTGTVYNDVNLNGQRDAGEAGLQDVKVFISADPNATQPAAGDAFVYTDTNGNYLIPNVDLRDGYVCVQPPSSRHQVGPTNYSVDTNVPAGTLGVIAGPNVGVKVPNSVRVSFNIDSNADGAVDSADATSNAFQVLLHADFDQDGVVDPNEPYSFTANNTILPSLPAGNQIIRVVPPQGWTTSLPGNALSFEVRSGAIPTLPTFTLKPVGVASASLSGTATIDADFTGTATAGDPPAALVSLWDDADADNVRDTNEAYAYTAGDGTYAFDGLTAGTHRIGIGNEAGTLIDGATNFTATTSASPSVQNLSLYPAARATRVSGTAFLDANNNGTLDATDPPIKGLGVVNAGTSMWASAVVTDANGRYTAYGTVGTQRPQLRTTSGYLQVNPITPVTLTAGGKADYNTLLIRATSTTVPPLGVLSGVVYQDTNFNGQRDTNEAGLAGTTVTLDTNLDGFATFDEPSVVTAADGSYVLPAVRQGSYRLILRYPNGTYVSTTFDGNVVSVGLNAAEKTFDVGATIGAPITGTVRDDHNQNGVVDTFDNLVQGVRVWADVNNDGQFNPATDPYAYTNSAGYYWIGRVSPAQSVNVYTDAYGTTTLAKSANAVAPAGTPGTNRTLPTMLVTTKTATIAARVYYDANRNGALDTNELRAGDTLTLRDATTNAVVATQVTQSGTYYAAFNNVAPGTYRLALEKANVALLQNAGGVLITIGAGDVSSDSIFGYANPTVNFRGRVLMDTAHDGANANDVPIAGVRAFIDVNSNGIYDDGDFAGISGNDGYFDIRNFYAENRTPYFGDLIVENPSGTLLISPYQMPVHASPNINGGYVGDFVYATPSGTYASGYIYEDRNTNGVRDPGEPGLRNVAVGSDFTSSSYDTVVTDREGFFAYRPPYAPAYFATIRTNLNNTWLSTDTPFGAAKTVTFVNGKASVDFGVVSWRLGGYAFTDSNGNNRFDTGETPIAGRRVWIDSNLNNVYDPGEQTATSAADGFWSFTNVGGGSYHIMQDGAAGFVTASRDVTLGETQARGGLDLASRPDNVPPTSNNATVSKITLDDGSTQRSMIRSISVTIGASVTAAGISAGAFALTQTSGTIAAYTLAIQSITPTNGGTVIGLIPSGPGMTAGSIANGRYTLTIDGSKIVDSYGLPIDAAATGAGASVKTFNFARLRSDANGSGTVDFNDFLLLQNAFGTSAGATQYLPGTDTDANGKVDFNDFLNLQNDFGLSV